MQRLSIGLLGLLLLCVPVKAQPPPLTASISVERTMVHPKLPGRIVVFRLETSATGALAAIDDARAVRTSVMGFAEAWNRHDMNAFGKLFTTDAEFVNVAGARWKGREQIQTQHAYSHGAIPADTPGFDAESRAYYGIFRTSTMRFDQIDVRFLGNDVALAQVNWALRGDARTTNPRRGLFLFVLTRQVDAWLIAAAQNTEIERAVK